ncbi:hypothetical protein [Paraburkholderia megapolitana]|uniref:MafI family immunity protein n=1 Tax=Paraburkholderia megapolitana TaxID=420953 RepID=A0A1I3VZ52_9BURK|nr:hypothetical protein [Paraburkholderia megapolitana]QDQ82264.1 hypothetical protein FNZ07_13295 [Paraburkholderia megapolitana]SFJ99496.1 hypothetical protein SAMN05192543_11515 [Paraburkholderia megapolitana]
MTPAESDTLYAVRHCFVTFRRNTDLVGRDEELIGYLLEGIDAVLGGCEEGVPLDVLLYMLRWGARDTKLLELVEIQIRLLEDLGVLPASDPEEP